jgi:HAD superfamily hydrolase (TIGR01456 family)
MIRPVSNILARRLTAGATRRASTAALGSQTRIGVSFDIDGVLVRGPNLLPHAAESLKRLQKANIPFVLTTNGGGEPEPVKAKKLSEVLGVPIHERQIVLSHSPLRPYIHKHRKEKILVLGCRDVVGVAKFYGAERPLTFQDVLHAEPLRFPFLHWDHKPGAAGDMDEPFGGVFVLHDPSLFGPELQVAIDVLRGGLPLGSGNSGQAVPCYFSNPDIIFAGLHPVPRLACGAFNHCLQSLFKEVTGHELKVTQCGKPTKLTMNFAAKTLRRWRDGNGGCGEDEDEDPLLFDPTKHFDVLVHVGDNPAADIRGAINGGHPWQGILVKTGVFQGGQKVRVTKTDRKGGGGGRTYEIEEENDPNHPADYVVQGVKEAVDIVISQQH